MNRLCCADNQGAEEVGSAALSAGYFGNLTS